MSVYFLDCNMNNNLKPENSNLHKGSKMYAEDDDINDIIEKSKCSKIYFQLEECLADNNRNWTKCQQEVL